MAAGFTKPGDKLLGIMPVVGIGTWEMNGSGCIESVTGALEMGYRHIDTAQIYGNEKEVGKAMRLSGIKREEIFLTTKIATGNLTPGRIRVTSGESLERLATDYVDLLLIHWPVPGMDLNACLKAMTGLKDKGFVRYIGVSNFDPGLFRKSLEVGPVLTNQVKFTPYNEEFENLRIAQEEGKIITAYSPLAKGRVVNDRVLAETGRKYGKSASQVSLRWLIQLGNVSVIPKANSERHQKENLDIFDFELSESDMEEINKLSRRLVW